MNKKLENKSKNNLKLSLNETIKKVALVGFVLAALLTTYFAFKIVRDKTSTWNVTPLNGLALPSSDPGSEPDPDEEDSGIVLVPSISGPTAPDWNGSSRVTILLVGLDYRDWENDSSAPRSDTMILVTFDPLTMSAGVLSIPRDLWVNVPGFGYGKINTAYQSGENAALPGGGPGLAMRTVEEFLGVQIDYFAQVDFNTFAEFIDLYGSVHYTPTEDMIIDMIGTDDRLRLYEGELVGLRGFEALALARFRGTSGADFDRSQRQQALLLGLIKRITEPYWLQYTLLHAGEIWDIFSSGIRTNMTLDEILGIGWKVKDIDIDTIIMRAIVPPNMVTLEKSPSGLDILKPITQEIRIIRDEVFNTTAIAGPIFTSDEIVEKMLSENATVAVYNGTNTAGLANSTEEYLVSLGINVVAIGNSDKYGLTTMNVYTNKAFTMQFLSEALNMDSSNIYYYNDPSVEVDIEIIVGYDWTIP